MAHKQRVTRTPQSWLGTLAEWAWGTAGRSIIIGDRWYRFQRRRGVLVASDARLADRPELHVEDVGEATAAEVRTLDAMIGARWSMLYNCATAFQPFWGALMASIVSPADRSSVARHVVLSVLAAAAIVAAVLFSLDWWMERKVGRIEARMEAQYRSVVAHFGAIKARLPKEAIPVDDGK